MRTTARQFWLSLILLSVVFITSSLVMSSCRGEDQFSFVPEQANRFTFPAVQTQWVRLLVGPESVCLDEVETYSSGGDIANPQKDNTALASRGTTVEVSSTLPGYAVHQPEHLIDGRYGNDYSWIPAEPNAWLVLKYPKPEEISTIVLSRDRTRKFTDRILTSVEVQVSADGTRWQTVFLGKNRNIPSPRNSYWAWGESMQDNWFNSQNAYSQTNERLWVFRNSQAPKDLSIPENERKFMRERLTGQFNPAAIRRAVEDLTKTYTSDQFTLPEQYQSRLEKYESILPKVLSYLETGDESLLGTVVPCLSFDQTRHTQVMALCQEMIAFQKSVLTANPLLNFDNLLVLQRRLTQQTQPMPYWDWGVEYGMTVNWSCDFRPKNPPSYPGLENRLISIALRDSDASDKQKNTSEHISANPSESTPKNTSANTPLSTQAGALRITPIFTPPKDRMIQQPEIDFDAEKILFTMGDDNGAFQLYETDIDGRNVRQITRDTAPDIDNGDGCYLPDGSIVFNSTCAFTGVPCEDGNSYVANLCRCDADGSNRRMLTFDQESNWHPCVMANGRVLYTRYEYANIGHQFGRQLFQMNPDGTNQSSYYGTNSYWPNSIFQARPIPGHRTQVVGIVCGHHGPNKTGRLVLFDPALGRTEVSGAVQTIPGWNRPVERIVEDTLYAMDWPKFSFPWPLSEKYYLVSGRISFDQKEYGIYLVDVYDNITELARIPGSSLFEPIPIVPRDKPPVIPERIDLDDTEATVLLLNVYEGPGLKGVPKGSVKKLRVFTYNYMYRHVGECGFGHVATPGGDGPWEPRYLLGEVPVRPDGSAYFKIPANFPIAVQPINDRGEALQLMRSWFVGMPGENVSCIGCHEDQNSTIPPGNRVFGKQQPDEIQPWRGPARGFDYAVEVQPVLDKYCIGCHDKDHPQGMDFTRKTLEQRRELTRYFQSRQNSSISTVFTASYNYLHPYVRRAHMESNLALLNPGEFRANTSLLVQMLTRGHHGVALDAEAWDRLYTWIDLGAPDQGSWFNSVWGVPRNYYQRRLDSFKRFSNRSFDVEWQPKIDETPALAANTVNNSIVNKAAADKALVDKATDDVTPADEATVDEAAVDVAAVDKAPVDEASLRWGDHPREIHLTILPGVEMKFVLVPGIEASEPFYMASTEVTNAQYRAASGEPHDSGFFSWLSFDQRGEGFAMNKADQPAVRLSWSEANECCERLSRLWNRRVRLPSAAEWEWSARAGTDTPFWYGDLDTDYSSFENLAGREMADHAFIGKPIWMLHERRFADHGIVTEEVARYKPNPWGLYDMLGNASEWTSDNYTAVLNTAVSSTAVLSTAVLSTAVASGEAGRITTADSPEIIADSPENIADGPEKTVCGGSFIDRPSTARPSIRWKYPLWQKVYNVGFRPVIEISHGK